MTHASECVPGPVNHHVPPHANGRSHCRRYDCVDLRSSCDVFVSKIDLTPQSFPRWVQLSADHGLPQALDHCLTWSAAGDNFSAVMG